MSRGNFFFFSSVLTFFLPTGLAISPLYIYMLHAVTHLLE
jgi:hypothetical protein